MYLRWLATYLVYVLLHHASGGWVVKPPPAVTSFTGDDLTLVYGYSTDPSYDSTSRISIAHYVPGRAYEDLLLDGNLNPFTGHIKVKQELYPNKINVTSYLWGFSIRVSNLSVTDSGQYLTDLKFTLYEYRHHQVTLTVYNRPYFLKTPSSDDVIAEKGSARTMQWTLSDVPSQPAIDSIQITHLAAGVSHTLVHQQALKSGQWGITYPDEQLRFKGRLSYAPGPNLESVDFNLWKLEVEDSGLYTIEIEYVDGVTNLSDAVRLHVASDYGWLSIPRSVTYLLESSAHALNFTADLGNSTIPNLTYELSKVTHKDKRETLVSLLKTGNATSHEFKSSWNPNWRLVYNSSTDSMLVQIPNVLPIDAGNYTIALKNETGNILTYHRFNVIVINETSLTPNIKETSISQTITLEIRVDVLVLEPYIIVYDGNTEEPHASARTNTLNTSISCLQEHVVVLVKYDSDGLLYEKPHPVNLSYAACNGSKQVKHSDGLTESEKNTSVPPTSKTGITSDEEERNSSVQFIILLGMQIAMICLLLSLAVMCFCYIKYWVHPRVNNKLNGYSPVNGTSHAALKNA